MVEIFLWAFFSIAALIWLYFAIQWFKGTFRNPRLTRRATFIIGA